MAGRLPPISPCRIGISRRGVFAASGSLRRPFVGPVYEVILALVRNVRNGVIWLFVTPTKRRAVCVQPHLHVTAAQAILKNLGWRFCSMAKLVFGLNQSLDGYVDHQEFAPGPSLFRHFTEQVRDLAGSVYGRRMYR